MEHDPRKWFQVVRRTRSAAKADAEVAGVQRAVNLETGPPGRLGAGATNA